MVDKARYPETFEWMGPQDERGAKKDAQALLEASKVAWREHFD